MCGTSAPSILAPRQHRACGCMEQIVAPISLSFCTFAAASIPTLWCVRRKIGVFKPRREPLAISLSRSARSLLRTSVRLILRRGRATSARSTTLYLSWTHLELLPPRHDPRLNKLPPLPVWVIRVWEEEALEGEEPIGWIRLPSVPPTTLEQAWERVDWYRAGFRVEDSHHCLKTGCRIEERHLQSTERLLRLSSFWGICYS
jgi:hypothetical protein